MRSAQQQIGVSRPTSITPRAATINKNKRSPEVVSALLLPEAGPRDARQARLLEELEAVEDVRCLAGGPRGIHRWPGKVNLRERVQRPLRLLARNAIQAILYAHVYLHVIREGGGGEG